MKFLLRETARLAKYAGPTFPLGVVGLMEYCINRAATTETLSGIARTIEGHLFCNGNIQTLDGVVWMVGLYFTFGPYANLAILVPHLTDGCSIAVYTKGKVPHGKVIETIEQLLMGVDALPKVEGETSARSTVPA